MIKNPYRLLDRWLHWIALESKIVRRLSFDLERQLYLPKDPQRASQGAVYVCGLARSGTTILLSILDEIPGLKSLTYRAMPFALAPNLWNTVRFGRKNNVTKTLRAHGDGIHIDLDSPEGLEEVFWQTFGHSVTSTAAHSLDCDEPSRETLAVFGEYRALVANPKVGRREATEIPGRYLSKNNNNLMRLPSLCSDPKATILLVYRDPIATAWSLYRQHQRFCKAQTEDHFIRRYMGWLAHHEFGLDHLPFAFAVPHMTPGMEPDGPNYWLDYWCAVHQHILREHQDNLYLINYDILCARPEGLLGSLLKTLELQADAKELAKLVRLSTPPRLVPNDAQHPEPHTSKSPIAILAPLEEFSSSLLRRAQSVHAALLRSGRNIAI